MRKRSNRAKAKSQRRGNAKLAQEHLSSVILNSSIPMIARRNAAKHLVKASSRNRLPIPRQTRHIICKGCKELLIPGISSRVRIRDGQKITTCLNCGEIRRFGGGPKYHRRLNPE